MPREFAVKTERSPEMTPKALLTESLRRIYQPVAGAKPEHFGQLLIELEQRLVERRKECLSLGRRGLGQINFERPGRAHLQK